MRNARRARRLEESAQEEWNSTRLTAGANSPPGRAARDWRPTGSSAPVVSVPSTNTTVSHACTAVGFLFIIHHGRRARSPTWGQPHLRTKASFLHEIPATSRRRRYRRSFHPPPTVSPLIRRGGAASLGKLAALKWCGDVLHVPNRSALMAHQ